MSCYWLTLLKTFATVVSQITDLLDPAYYYTLPGFTLDTMLKHTDINFELLTNSDMVMFVERGIRGGLTREIRFRNQEIQKILKLCVYVK